MAERRPKWHNEMQRNAKAGFSQMLLISIWNRDYYIYIYISGQIIVFHQPRFPWNKGISLSKPPFGVRSCEVAIIWQDILYITNPKNALSFSGNPSNVTLHLPSSLINHPKWVPFKTGLHTSGKKSRRTSGMAATGVTSTHWGMMWRVAGRVLEGSSHDL